MNIESLLNKIKLFDELVIDSGFKRDSTDFFNTIQQGHNRNLVFMQDLSSKLQNHLSAILNNGLDAELDILLKENDSFTSLDTYSELIELDKDKEIDANQYFQKFNTLLSQLNQSIATNITELDSVRDVFEKYVPEKESYHSEGEQALVSLVFKDLRTTGSILEFSKVLNRWNRTLLIYHTLLKPESPKEITLEEIQNGSIDVIFNIDFDVAIDLTELIKTGLKVYGAYLLYKSEKAREIIDSYMGNKKLIKMEQERETLMLDNIKDSIKEKALEQHQEKLSQGLKVDKVGAAKKADEVSSVLTDHIVKGNELKLLTPPISESEEDEENEKDISTELREETSIVRERYKKLNTKEKQLLLDKYTIKDDEEDKKGK